MIAKRRSQQQNWNLENAILLNMSKSVIGILEFTATCKRRRNTYQRVIHMGERKNKDQVTVNKEPGRSNIGYQRMDINLKSRYARTNYVVETSRTGN